MHAKTVFFSIKQNVSCVIIVTVVWYNSHVSVTLKAITY